MPRILVVDDDRWMVRTLCDLLRQRGFAVHGVHSGEEALAAVDAQAWSAVIMDVRMEGMTGIEALKALRTADAGLPVILTTAWSVPETIQEADRNGVERVLVKPFAPRQLLHTLDAALAGGASVLVVDDDPAFLKTLADALAEQGRRTLRARSAAEALPLLRQRPTRIVLLDLVLDGAEPGASARAIREVSPAVPLVLYSGHDDLLAQVAASHPECCFRAVVAKSALLAHLTELIDDSSCA